MSTSRQLGTYLHLARASSQRQQRLVRDKLLVLAGVTAAEMGLDDVSALCRRRVLAHNGRHLVRQWPSLSAAILDPGFQSYLKQLRRRYSPERSEQMLWSLGIEMASERALYETDCEYGHALLAALGPEASSANEPESADVGTSAVAVRSKTRLFCALAAVFLAIVVAAIAYWLAT